MKHNPSPHAMRASASALAILLLAPACADDPPDSTGGAFVDPIEAGELTEVQPGNTGLGPLPDGVEFVPAARTGFDGDADPELQRFLTAAGVARWQPIEGDARPDDVVARMKANADSTNALSYVGMVTPSGHYMIEVDADRMAAAFAGVAVAPPGDTEYDADPQPDADPSSRGWGWSRGVDSRVRRTGTMIPNKLGMVTGSGQCTGALIGSRIVRTAAHCVVLHTTGGGQAPGTVTFDYRRDGVNVPATASSNTVIYGGAYMPNGCARRTTADRDAGYRANFDACTWADWAYIILPPNWWGSQAISWYGYKGLTSNDLGTELQAGGYPACGSTNPGVPAGCVTWGYYRDTSADCKVAQWTNGQAKWRTGCDNSPGHSGGPAWQENTWYLLGHFQWQDCGTCSASQTAPNHYLGHDTWLFNFQNSLRSTYP